MLGCLVPMLEPMGWRSRTPDTLLGYDFTPHSVVAILISAALGLAVSLSTFLVIGATSSLTYNVVGGARAHLFVYVRYMCVVIMQPWAWRCHFPRSW